MTRNERKGIPKSVEGEAERKGNTAISTMEKRERQIEKEIKRGEGESNARKVRKREKKETKERERESKGEDSIEVTLYHFSKRQ